MVNLFVYRTLSNVVCYSVKLLDSPYWADRMRQKSTAIAGAEPPASRFIQLTAEDPLVEDILDDLNSDSEENEEEIGVEGLDVYR